MGEPVFKFVGAHLGAIAVIIVTVMGWAWTASSKNSELAGTRADYVELAASVESVKADVASSKHEQTQMRVDLAEIKIHLGWLVKEARGGTP